MSDRVRAVNRMPFLKDSVDRSSVLQEVRLREIRKNSIRKEILVLEPRKDYVARSVVRLDDPSKPWYITHV
jgi:hypothetical protein